MKTKSKGKRGEATEEDHWAERKGADVCMYVCGAVVKVWKEGKKKGGRERPTRTSKTKEKKKSGEGE